MTDFNLSEKIDYSHLGINPTPHKWDSVTTINVKEFIRLLKESICKETLLFDDEGIRWLMIKLDALAGEKFK